MPRLGPDMDEGTLIEWNMSVDDEVQEGAVLATIESDKSEVELESRWHAMVAELVVEPGTVVPVGGVIAVLYKPGTDPGPLGAIDSANPATSAPSAGSSSAQSSAETAPQSPPGGAPATSKAIGTRRPLSPMVRRLLKESGLSADEVTGTGPGGKIQRSDVEAVIAAQSDALKDSGTVGFDATAADQSSTDPSPAASTGPGSQSGDPHRFVLTKVEKTGGRRMVESRSTIPDFAISRRIDMSAALATKKALADRGTPVSLNDMILFATTRALVEYPRINGVFEGEAVVAQAAVDLAMAIATPDGLIAAVLPQCQQLSLVEIGSKSRELVERVRVAKLRPEDLGQGSFTVSNLGMYGVDRFQPIINPPHVAIMGVGRITDQLVLNSLGVPMAVPMIELTVVGDHRAVDGVALALFLASLESFLSGSLA